MSNHKVKIQIHSKIKYENGQEERLHVDAVGDLYLKEEHFFLRYQETEKEMGNTWTVVKWPKERTPITVVIIRQRNVKMKQVFQEGVRIDFTYQSPYGALEMEILTHRIHLSKPSLNKGEIGLQYQLTRNKQIIGTYHLDLYYQRIEGGKSC